MQKSKKLQARRYDPPHDVSVGNWKYASVLGGDGNMRSAPKLVVLVLVTTAAALLAQNRPEEKTKSEANPQEEA